MQCSALKTSCINEHQKECLPSIDIGFYKSEAAALVGETGSLQIDDQT